MHGGSNMHSNAVATEELPERETEAQVPPVPPRQPARDREELSRRLRFQAVQDHALFTLDSRGRMDGWTAGAEHLLGYGEAEITGQPFSRTFTPEDVELGLPDRQLHTAVLQGSSEEERWHARKDGSRFWAAGAVTALRDGGGGLRGYGVVMRDGSDPEELHEALRRRAEALGAAARRQNEVLATVAHELRTPLSVIPLYLRTIRRSDPGHPAIGEAVRGIQEEVGQVVRLVDDLLDATRVSRGKVALRKERVNLGAVIERAVQATRPLFASRNQRLAVSAPPGPVYLDADPLRLRQVLVNLLDNAAMYTNPGGRIWLTATAGGEEAVVRVRDTGIGIVPERMSSIFELFTQVECSQGGLGIGLAVVRTLVEMHQGTVQVRSQGLGQGSEFIVCLPVEATAP
jgi:PAS domain S-box-containing protein